MKTYPYTTPEGIIELVEKTEHDAAVAELLVRARLIKAAREGQP